MTYANLITIIIVVAALVAVIAVSMLYRRQTRERAIVLRQRFGPEYDRAVQLYGPDRANRVLAARARRVDKMTFHELSDLDRARFTSAWDAIQLQFVDDPRAAVVRANDLIKDVMRARGYSADDAFEQRAADLSVDHPEVVEHYRAGRAFARAGSGRALATEELRQAVVHYRVIFADLLQPARPVAATVQPVPAHA